MVTKATQSGPDKKNPDRRAFMRSLGAASVGLAASGVPALGSATKSGKNEENVSHIKNLDPEGPLKIGIIGRTGHLNVIFEGMKKVPGAGIAAYAFEDGEWEFNSDGTKRSRGGYDLATQRKWAEGQSWYREKVSLYETYQEMFDKEKLDVVVVFLPYARNAYAAAAAARAGLHVLCEKPVAVNFADLEMLERAVNRNKIRLSAMFSMRYAPAVYTIRQAVSRGLVGRPCMARAQKSYKFGTERPWFYKHREIFGSSILWVGIHAIDYIRWTTGLEVRRVSAFHGNLAHPGYPGCQDHAVVSMECEGGASAAVTLDYLRPAKAPTHGDDRLRVIGSSGVVEKRELEQRVELITSEQGPRELPIESPPSLFADFIGELRGASTHLVGPDEAIRVTRICIAATQAAEEGRVMEV